METFLEHFSSSASPDCSVDGVDDVDKMWAMPGN